MITFLIKPFNSFLQIQFSHLISVNVSLLRGFKHYFKMKEGETMDHLYTVASSSASTTYGNIMTFLKDLIVRTSPIEFKETRLSSEIAYVNIRRRLGRNTLNEISKLERPFLMINPQIQVPSGDLYLYDIPLTKNFDNMEFAVSRNTLNPFITNEEELYTACYKLNRDRIQFDITITVDTSIQQLDLWKYYLNHYIWERPYAIETSLESMIPREIIRQIGLFSNIDIDKKENTYIPTIMRTLNRFSSYPITYKMRNGTGNDEFFLYYNTKVLLNFTDLSIDQVNRKNMADDFYTITFRCDVEFNLPAVYTLIGHDPRPKCLEVAVKSKNPDGSHDLIPLFTVDNFFSKYPPMLDGFMLYASSRFQTEMNEMTKQDELDLGQLFDQSYLDILHTYYARNIPMETLINVILLKDGEENHDWRIRWNSLKLTINHADDRATYCIIIYINNLLFNEELSYVAESTMKDKPHI